MSYSYEPVHCINRYDYYFNCSELSIELIKEAINNNNLPSRIHLLKHAIKSPFLFLYKIYNIFLNIADYLILEASSANILSRVKALEIIHLSITSLKLNINEFVLKICGVAVGIIFVKKGCEILIKAEEQNKKGQEIWKNVFKIFSNDTNRPKKTYLNHFNVQLERTPRAAIDCLGYNLALHLNNKSKKVDSEQEEKLIREIFQKIINAIHELDTGKSSKFLKKIIISHPYRKPHFKTPHIERFFVFSQDEWTKKLNEFELDEIWIQAISTRKIHEINILFNHLYFNLEYELMYNRKFVLREEIIHNISRLFVIFNSQRFGSTLYSSFETSILRDSRMVTLGSDLEYLKEHLTNPTL